VVCGSSVTPSNVVRDLGVWVDSGLTMSTHITKTVAGCFATLRQLRSVRRSLSRDAFTRLVVALVLSRLDYCNGILAGLPASQLNRLQSVLHASARLIYAPVDMITSSHCYNDFTGCPFLNAWSSNCAS